MPIIQVGGLATYYERIGSGPVLLLLHGWANSWEAWMPVIPYLSDHFTLIIPDLPGCGKTATPSEGWNTERHARWLESLLSSVLGEESAPFFAAGHSYGGKMLLEFCSGNYTPQPQKLVMLDASGIPNILSTKQKILRGLAALTPAVLKKSLKGSIRQKVYDSFGADSDYVWANAFQQQTLQQILKEDYTDQLARIGISTLLLWGKADKATPLWQGESMHTLIPLNRLQIYDAGHFPHHTYPTQVSETIIRFLV